MAQADRDDLDYALANIGGVWGKLDDARAGRYGMTAERAVEDSVDVLGYYIRWLCRELGRPVPVSLRELPNG